MARNNYLGSPAELQRLEDFNYDLDQDRGPINALATAYAGMPLVYPDVIGGNFGGRPFDSEVSEKVKKYLMRNAQWLSLHPSMAVGKGPWNYKDKLVEKTVLEAVLLHDRLFPYIYSQAIRFYHDGYPWTMCPLPIAYYQDKNVDNRENNVIRGYQWMIGDSIMATPLYGNDYEQAQTRDVYLPKGIWIDYDSGNKYTGPQVLSDFPLPFGKTPVFIGGTGIVIEKEKNSLVCRLYPVNNCSQTVFYSCDAVTESRITVDKPNWKQPEIIDLTVNEKVVAKMIRYAWQFDFIAGHNYCAK
jgi:alpha-glucosidase (family GH31 glycosyl hydrolase)